MNFFLQDWSFLIFFKKAGKNCIPEKFCHKLITKCVKSWTWVVLKRSILNCFKGGNRKFSNEACKRLLQPRSSTYLDKNQTFGKFWKCQEFKTVKLSPSKSLTPNNHIENNKEDLGNSEWSHAVWGPDHLEITKPVIKIFIRIFLPQISKIWKHIY